MTPLRETRVDWPVVGGVRLRVVGWRGDGARAGTVLICSGRTEFVEKYADVVQRLVDRRLDVLAFDWRGQGLSDRLLADPAKGHVPDYDHYLDDLGTVAGLMAQRGFPQPRVMLAHSMGGQVGMRFLHRCPDVFVGAAMTAPMFGIRFKGLPTPLVRALVQLMCLAGRSESYGFGQGPRSYAYRPFEGNLLTGSKAEFRKLRSLLDADPRLALGGPTFGWARASLRSMATSRRRRFAEGVGCPILLALAEEEGVVDNRAIEDMARWLPRADLLRLADARHEILIERHAVQAAFWEAFDAWFSRLPNAARPPS